MPESRPQWLTIGELADTNPETVGVGADPRAQFKYVDLSSVKLGSIAWNSAPDLTLLTAPSRARRVLRRGDVLFGTVRPNLQSHGYVDWTGSGALVGSTGFSVIRAKAGVSDSRYLFHCIMSSGVTAQANRDAVGSSYPALNDSDVRQFEVFAPSIREQMAVAQILDTLDTTIRQTEAIIEKLKQVKQGLLHDLLTRGIDANGELRPPQSQAPYLYTGSPLGWIPKDWAASPIGSLVRYVTYGFTSPMPTTSEGPWMLTAADIADGCIDFSSARKTSRREFVRLSRKSRPSKGDILVTKDGTLGRVAVLDREDVCVNQSVAILSPFEPATGEFLALYLRSPRGQDRMIADAGGSTIKHIYISTLAKMLVPGPSATEAAEIGRRANSLEQRIVLEASQLLKLGALKSGLMDDLLTGRIRVNPCLT